MQPDEKALAAAADTLFGRYDAHYNYDCWIDPYRPRAEGRLAAAITAYLAALPPESPAQQPATDADLLSAMQINWELHWGPYKGDESDCCWQVHRVNGGRNDREWTLVGIGETPREALTAALSQSPAKAGDSLQQRPAAEEKRA